MRDAPKIRGIVLLADGSQAILDSLKKAFAKTDYALLHARTGKQAITLLERLKADIDLAIIDLDFEDVNGLEVVGLLTAPGRKPSKIIVSTSRHHEPQLKQVKHLGIHAIMPRPLAPEELVETIRTLLSEGSGQSLAAVV